MFRVIAVLVIVSLVALLVAGVHLLEEDIYWNHYHPPDDDGCSVRRDDNANRD